MEADSLDLETEYVAKRHAGQLRIRNGWEHFLPETRAVLTASGFYSDAGAPVEGVERLAFEPEFDVERLEVALGTLSACAKATLPNQSEQRAPIPSEALNGDVLDQCTELLRRPAWRDPVFLRLGLHAVVKHETAKAQALATPFKKRSIPIGCLSAIAMVVLVLLLPVAVGAALVAASDGNLGGTVLALYAAAICAWPAWWSKQKEAGKDVPEQDRHYLAWLQFQTRYGDATIGAGAKHYLEWLSQKGVQVPAVAFDLCAALQART